VKLDQTLVTPETAREWLESTRINRPLRGDQVKAYARDMREGRWRPVGDPIRIDRLGRLIDGQHRLSAIVESGVSLSLVVISGLEPEDQLVIDSGVKRRAADQLILGGQHNMKYGVRAASVARAMATIDAGRAFDNKMRVTNPEIFEAMEKYPGIIDSVVAVEGLHRVAGISPLNAGIVHLVGTERIPDTTFKFFADLRSGAGLGATDPVLLLRNRLLSGYEVGSRMHQLWLALRALELRKEEVYSYTKLQLPRDSRITSDVLVEKIDKIHSYRDERESRLA